MAVISTAQFKNGLTIKVDNGIWRIEKFQHVKPGKGGAFVRTTLRNLRTDAVQEKTFRSGAKMEQAMIDDRTMQYLYNDSAGYVFMDMNTYDQVTVPENRIKNALKYLKVNMEVSLIQYNGETIGVQVPNTITLEVADTQPAIKGNTASGGSKPATMTTGLTVQVPFFVKTGEKIMINTTDGSYISRA